MAIQANQIHASDLSQRLPLRNSDDELDQLGMSFNELLSRLEESFERQSRFVRDASHQLRTPLTAMLGQAEVPLRRNRSNSDYHDTIERIHAEAIRLDELVETLLFLARSEGEATLSEVATLNRLSRFGLTMLLLSGVATGLSWLCYYRALQMAPASRVAPIDKLSILLVIRLAILFLGEPLTWNVVIGGGLILGGVLVLAT